MTNATKAQAITLANALLALAVLFGVGLSAAQLAGATVALNALGALIVGLTYKDSAKRIPGS